MWRLSFPKARHVVALTVFLLLLLISIYVLTRHTASYEAAEKFLMSDARVSSAVGPVERIKFKFWDGFDFSSLPNGGEATFTFEVTSIKGTSIVELHLRSSSGTWRVTAAEVRAPRSLAARIVRTEFSQGVTPPA